MGSYEHVTLWPHVSARYDIDEGNVTVHRRDDPSSMYGLPSVEDAFIWPEEAERFIVTLLREVKCMDNGRRYGCYHSMPSLDAAIMFVFAAT